MKPSKPTVHILRYGHPLCGFHGGPPRDWPEGHSWVSAFEPDVAEATCKACEVAISIRARDESNG